MSPQEWDAWRVYWSVWPRFDPWLAVARVLSVVVGCLTGEEVAAETFYPKIEAKRPKRRRRTADDDDAFLRGFFNC